MNLFQKSIFFGLAPLFLSFSAKADVKVVTTIKPLHSLVSSVMEGVGEPSLIIEGTNNPHTFVFKPSHAELLEEADIVFWIGEGLEAFMEKPLDSLASNAKKVAFMDLASIEKLEKKKFDLDQKKTYLMITTITMITMAMTMNMKATMIMTIMMGTKMMITTITMITMAMTMNMKATMIMTIMMGTKMMITTITMITMAMTMNMKATMIMIITVMRTANLMRTFG